MQELKTVPKERAVSPRAATSTNERRENWVGLSVDLGVGAGAGVVVDMGAGPDRGFAIGADVGIDVVANIGADGDMVVLLAFSWYY